MERTIHSNWLLAHFLPFPFAQSVLHPEPGPTEKPHKSSSIIRIRPRLLVNINQPRHSNNQSTCLSARSQMIQGQSQNYYTFIASTGVNTRSTKGISFPLEIIACLIELTFVIILFTPAICPLEFAQGRVMRAFFLAAVNDGGNSVELLQSNDDKGRLGYGFVYSGIIRGRAVKAIGRHSRANECFDDTWNDTFCTSTSLTASQLRYIKWNDRHWLYSNQWCSYSY